VNLVINHKMSTQSGKFYTLNKELCVVPCIVRLKSMKILEQWDSSGHRGIALAFENMLKCNK